MTISVWSYLKEYEAEKAEVQQALETVFRSGRLILGESVKAFEQTVVETPDMRLDRGNAHLSDQLHPCDPGIERRNRRSAAVESPRGRVG